MVGDHKWSEFFDWIIICDLWIIDNQTSVPERVLRYSNRKLPLLLKGDNGPKIKPRDGGGGMMGFSATWNMALFSCNTYWCDFRVVGCRIIFDQLGFWLFSRPILPLGLPLYRNQTIRFHFQFRQWLSQFDSDQNGMSSWIRPFAKMNIILGRWTQVNSNLGK